MSIYKSVLYTETNFLMGIATGRDSRAMDFLRSSSDVLVAIPQICIMEALTVLNATRRRTNQFVDSLGQKINEVRRDSTSEHATALEFHLREARLASPKLLDDINNRLLDAMLALESQAALIGLSGDALKASLSLQLIDDPTDNLILHCILDHARDSGIEVKALLTENSRDFDRQEVRDALTGAGIARYFRSTTEFVDANLRQSEP